MLFITFPSKFNITNTLPAALQLRLVTHHPSLGLRWRARAALLLAWGWSPHCLWAHLSLLNPTAARQLSFWQCCAFFPVSVTIPWLMSNSQCSCPSLLLPLLPLLCLLAPYRGPCLWISALYCFLHSEVRSIFAAFVFPLFLLRVVLCCPLFSWHRSLSCAEWLLFPLWEMSLKNTLPLHQRVK